MTFMHPTNSEEYAAFGALILMLKEHGGEFSFTRDQMDEVEDTWVGIKTHYSKDDDGTRRCTITFASREEIEEAAEAENVDLEVKPDIEIGGYA